MGDLRVDLRQSLVDSHISAVISLRGKTAKISRVDKTLSARAKDPIAGRAATSVMFRTIMVFRGLPFAKHCARKASNTLLRHYQSHFKKYLRYLTLQFSRDITHFDKTGWR